MSQDKRIATLQQVKALVDEVISELKQEVPGRKSRPASSKQGPTIAADISFNLSVLAFMSKYARGLSGPQKFTLLIARLVKGSTTTETSFQEVKKRWNKMKTVMGSEFNPVNANRAKAEGWVDTTKHGVYVLCNSWKEYLTQK